MIILFWIVVATIVASTAVALLCYIIRYRRETVKAGIFTSAAHVDRPERFGREELYAQSHAMLNLVATLTHECQQLSGSYQPFRSGGAATSKPFIEIWETQPDLS